MKQEKDNKKRNRIFVVVIAAVALVMLGNTVIINRIGRQQIDQIGGMRIQNITDNFQRYLTDAENALERAGDSLSVLVEQGASEEEIRQFLLRQRDTEYEISGGSCLNLFCAVDGKVMISGMETPRGYVLQDRDWYRGLMATHKGDIYISSVYDDAFTDHMCFTVAKVLDDGTTMVGLDYDAAGIQNFVGALTQEGYEEALIVDSNEVIVGYTDEALVGQKLSTALPQYRNVFLRIIASDEDSLILRLRDGRMRSAVFSSRTENGWYLICTINSRILYQDSFVRVLKSSAAAILIIAALMVLYLAVNRSKRSTRPKRARKSVRKQKEKESAVDGDSGDFTVAVQKKYQIGITAIFVATMLMSIFICVRMTVNDSRIKMEEEMRRYNYEVGDWVLEQKSILDMFENVVVAKPDILDSYEGMVKFLDDITKHYPKISATYIANPDFAHDHPMVMNNGWIPAADYVEEERAWYTGALTAKDFNITEPYFDARTGEYCITFSKVVKSEKGEFYGVFAIDFYLNVLTDILGESYTSEGYAFLVDKNGLIIDHPNAEYEFSDEDSPNIHDLVYDRLYGENDMVTFRDYDGTYRVGDSMEENESGFRIIVVKDWWSIYGNVLEYMLLFLVLFGVCIFAVNAVMRKMIRWQWNANKRLQEMAASAIRAEQAKSLFLSNMSHEIRTPINAVLGMNEMILRECSDEQMLSYAKNIQSAGKTLLFLINDILDMSKIESGKMEIVPAEYDLGELILDLWNVICLRAQEKGLAITFHIDPDMPRRLCGDDVRVKQIVTNLLTNAVKYTPQGSVEMNVSCREEKEDSLTLVISVKDTGMGIKEEDLGKLFEKFQRIDEKNTRNIEGTGLGMNITMSLLELMDGDMKVDSVYGKGSEFTVTIPQKIVDREPVGDFETLRSRVRTNADVKLQSFEAPEARVLAVDDNSMNLAVFQALLKRTGVQIVTASSGRECLELVQKEKYHIIFMDHMMPEMDGIETLHKMRELPVGPNTETPVIALTANAIVGAKEMYLKEGFVDFLTKPIEGALLEQMVLKYLPPELVRAVEQEPSKEAQQEDGSASEGAKPEDAVLSEQEERCLQEGISVKQGLAYAGGNMDVYLDLMGMFVREQEAREEKLHSLLKEENMADYAVLVHALKSNARMLGAGQLADIAYEHEKAGRDGQLSYVQEHWEELSLEWGRCRQSLEAFYHEYREDKEENYTVAEGEEIYEIPADEMDEVLKWLDEFQTPQAIERMKEWLAKPLEPKMHDKVRNALRAVEEEFEEEKAISLLKS